MSYYKNKSYNKKDRYEFMHMPCRNNIYNFNIIFKDRDEKRWISILRKIQK